MFFILILEPSGMKNLLFAFCLIFSLASCNDEILPPGTDTEVPEDTSAASYSGEYAGLVSLSISAVDSTGVWKTDTSYAYTVKVEYAGTDKITIHGQTDLEAIPVDDEGHFEFHDYSRDIEGFFIDDSLYIYSDAISGSYDPPQFYTNEKMTFIGEK